MEGTKKHTITIDDSLYEMIKDYCQTNSIKSLSQFANGLIKKGLMIELYGDTPFAKYEVVEHNNQPNDAKMVQTHDSTQAPKGTEANEFHSMTTVYVKPTAEAEQLTVAEAPKVTKRRLK